MDIARYAIFSGWCGEIEEVKMGEIHLDLRRDATRRYIRDNLLDRLDPAARNRIQETVEIIDIPGGHCHDLSSIEAVIFRTPVSEKVKSDLSAIYQVLAKAEARVHGCPVSQAHFHEVGDASHLRDVIAICLAIESLAPSRITATLVQIGCGSISCAHGVLDIPAPATAQIIAQGIPPYEERRDGEWCTPTSAAVILHFVDRFES
jgi:pyridinium-3,5-bisthiocarboxylic acid mononucleotide nickel chelatase